MGALCFGIMDQVVRPRKRSRMGEVRLSIVTGKPFPSVSRHEVSRHDRVQYRDWETVSQLRSVSQSRYNLGNRFPVTKCFPVRYRDWEAVSQSRSFPVTKCFLVTKFPSVSQSRYESWEIA